jgi:hypothetical protein
MPRIIIKQPNNKWAVFSTIVDDFLLQNGTEKDVIDFFVADFGEACRQDIERTIQRGGSKYYTFDDVMEIVERKHGKEVSEQRLKECE